MEHRSHEAYFSVQEGCVNHGNQRIKEFAPDVALAELLKEKQVGGALNCSDSELCTFLLALAEGYLPTFYSDTSPSVQLSGMDIASKSYQHGKKTVTFHGFQSLEMSKPLMDDLGEELLTLFRAGFPAKTSQQPEKAQESMENDQECGATWQGSLAKYDPDTSLWRTAQCSLLEDLNESLATLPRSGMTRSGLLWELPMLEQTISETGFGLWPTPVSSDISMRTTKYKQGGTPLSYAVQYWPTPTAHMAKETNAPSEANRNEPSMASRVGGKLNPTWVEWLMGWPLGWTDLKPLETDKCPSALPQHGGC
jgi:hypothetical protein